MRSTVALSVLAILTLAPAAIALPGLAYQATEPAAPDASGGGALETVRDAAANAAGLPRTPAPVDPIQAPLAGGGWSGLALGALALAGIASVASAFFLLGGARFVTPAEVLQNDVRQQIFAYLKQTVGANLKQLTDELHLTTTNAIWHLRKLEEAGLIHSRRFNGYKVFYPAEGGVEARRLSLGKTALANDNAQEVFQHVLTHPGTHQREIARALGVNHGTVRWHLKKLMHAELIVETRKGKASAYEPTPMGLHALREVTLQKTASAPVAPVGTAA